MSLHLIHLDVLARSLVEDILVVHIFVCDCGCVTPHNVSQADWGSFIRCKIHRRSVTGLVNHWERRVYFIEIDISPVINERHYPNMLGNLQLIDSVLGRHGFFQAQTNHFPRNKTIV